MQVMFDTSFNLSLPQSQASCISKVDQIYNDIDKDLFSKSSLGTSSWLIPAWQLTTKEMESDYLAQKCMSLIESEMHVSHRMRTVDHPTLFDRG